MRISDWSSDVCSSDLHQRYLAVALVFVLVKMLFVTLAGGIACKMKLRAVQAGVEQSVEFMPQPARPKQKVAAGSGCLGRSEEHTSELQSLMRISYAVFCLKKKKYNNSTKQNTTN